jgi:uncharacterized protein
MERMKFSFPPTVRAALEPVFSDERVRKIILFGSRAIGDHDERSDFDLAISAPTIDRRGLVGFWDHIETSSTLFCISISLLENMPNALRDRVLSTGVIVYERP